MKITKEALEKLGFVFADLGDEAPYEQCERDGVIVWDFNGKYWLVDALDQGGLHVEFSTLEELDAFWRACRLPALLPNNADNPSRPKSE